MPFRAEVHDTSTLGFALQQARLVKGLTQRQLAEQLGVSQRYIWELEAGKESLAITRLLGALKATGATLYIDVPEPTEDYDRG